jgi:two-component system NtrC family sensor kinase
MWAAGIVPAVMFAVAAVQSHGSAFQQASEKAEHAVRIANEHALRILQTNALAFDRVTEDVSGYSDAEVTAAHDRIQARLRSTVDRIPALKTLTVWGADGKLLVSSDKRSAPRSADAAGEEFFLRPAGPQGSGYHFSEQPDPDEKTGQLLVVSHRRLDGRGRFNGVVAAAIRPSYFFEYYTELSRAEPGMSVALFESDGSLVTRTPWEAKYAFPAPMSSPLMKRVAAGERAGMLEMVSSLDRQRRVVAFRRISDTPLYTASSIAHEAVLAQWRATLALLAAFTFPIQLALVVVTRIAWLRTRRAHAALSELNAEADKRLKAEAALRQAQKLEALGHLTGGVAHDVNNLLMVVNNNAHLLDRMRGGTEMATPIASIKRAVEAGTRLTRQLLAFSRRQAWRPEVIDLRQWLPAVIELLRHTLTREIELHSQIAADVLAVEADPAELELALLNLTINARDAMPQGGKLVITVANAAPNERLPADGEFVEIAITDNGIGIVPELLERVFEPFFTTKEVGKGTGLGLSQVYGLCTQAGGTAVVASRLGKGTTVTMYLRATHASASPLPSSSAIPQASGTVLMVEDNDDVAQATHALLVSIGYTVVRVNSAAQAIATLDADATQVDVVLSDIVMAGGMDGLELALALRRSHRHLPVLLMTGYTSRLEAAVAAGFTVIAKPCPPEQLAAALRHATRATATPAASNREAA